MLNVMSTLMPNDVTSTLRRAPSATKKCDAVHTHSQSAVALPRFRLWQAWLECGADLECDMAR